MAPALERVGRVAQIGDGVATVSGLPETRLDELLVFGLTQLDSYEPHEFFKVEMIRCAGRTVIRAYSHAYMERVSRRAQALLPPCHVPPLP